MIIPFNITNTHIIEELIDETYLKMLAWENRIFQKKENKEQVY